jgi:hypothetical protein
MQPVDKVVANPEQREPIVVSDQGSHQGYQCSETTLRGDPRSRSVGALPRRETLPP